MNGNLPACIRMLLCCLNISDSHLRKASVKFCSEQRSRAAAAVPYLITEARRWEEGDWRPEDNQCCHFTLLNSKFTRLHALLSICFLDEFERLVLLLLLGDDFIIRNQILRLWLLVLLSCRLRQFFLLLRLWFLLLSLPLTLQQVRSHPNAETFLVAAVYTSLGSLRDVADTQAGLAFLEALQLHSLTGSTEESPAWIAAMTFVR